MATISKEFLDGVMALRKKYESSLGIAPGTLDFFSLAYLAGTTLTEEDYGKKEQAEEGKEESQETET